MQKLFQRLVGITPRLARRPNGVWVVSYYNVAVAAWLAQRERELVALIRTRPAWQRPWLQALFDDEGHVHVTGSTRRVRASQDDVRVLQTAKVFLKTLCIGSRIDHAAKAVEITGRQNLETFRQRINFSTGIRINEYRKNGLCAEPIEKRAMLERALASYRVPAAL